MTIHEPCLFWFVQIKTTGAEKIKTVVQGQETPLYSDKMPFNRYHIPIKCQNRSPFEEQKTILHGITRSVPIEQKKGDITPPSCLTKVQYALFQIFSQESEHGIVEVHGVFFTIKTVAFIVFYHIRHFESLGA